MDQLVKGNAVSEFENEYRRKLIPQHDLAAKFKPGDVVQLGIFYAQPYGLIKAIEGRAADLKSLRIMVVHALGPWRYMGMADTAVLTGFLGPFERGSQKQFNNVFYTPMQFTDGIKLARDWNRFDYVVQRVTPMDERGNFNLSMSGSWEYNAIRWLHANAPHTKIVFEVNPNMPRVCGIAEYGDNEIHISEVDYIVEDESPMVDFPTDHPGERERAIAANVAALVEDRSTIQLGFGNIPMAIGKELSQRKELGIHTEMFCEAHVDMIEAGSVTNAHKWINTGISVATFALGERRLRDFVRENKAFAMVPVEGVNSVVQVAKNNKMVSINSVLMVDLSGQACAHCLGPKTYSGVGGAFEFAYGAQLSPGGKAIACLPSTTKLKDGRVVSNILAQFEAGTRITLPEHSVDWVVTEFGAVRLKMMMMEER
ncbi:hypothetical protein HYR69_00840, partial [Candidatus Sumerlaeota bacterium]|nr:hypothetical protein [Candidatus Sumerlaeota bacterium]